MDVFEFARRFDTETKCKSYLNHEREKEGITCKSCEGQLHFYLANKKQWQCKHCDYRTTLTSGTIMENTKLPIQKWFLAMFWMTSSKKSISTLELMRKLKLTRFETAHNLAKKIRLMMSHHNDSQDMGEYNEADESFLVTANSRANSQRGRGTQKTLVHILACYQPKDPDGPNNGKAFKNVKMDVIDDASSKSIKQVWNTYLDKSSKVTTDGFKSYKAIRKDYPGVTQEIASGKNAVKHLPWVHTMASNFKKINLGIFHNTVKPANIQHNLDEFCFKTNLRNHMDSWIGILLTAGIGTLWNPWL